MSAATPLTRLVLRRVRGVRRDRLRFGEPLSSRRTGRGETKLWFASGAVFCAVFWRRNAYGTVSWRLYIARAGAPDETLTRLPGVVPGAHALAVFRGADRVRRALKTLSMLEAAGLTLADISPAYWRRFQERVAQSRLLAPPSERRLESVRVRRIALS